MDLDASECDSVSHEAANQLSINLTSLEEKKNSSTVAAQYFTAISEAVLFSSTANTMLKKVQLHWERLLLFVSHCVEPELRC